MKKKLIVAVAILLAIVVAGLIIYWETSHGNRRLIDTQNRFNYAVIQLPNGQVVEGKVTSWLDYNDSDVVQITMGGKTYLTHYSNVCLIHE